MKQQQSDKEILVCFNCKSAKDLDHYLGLVKDKDEYTYSEMREKYIAEIDHLFAYCPGDPWCELDSESKKRQNS